MRHLRMRLGTGIVAAVAVAGAVVLTGCGGNTSTPSTVSSQAASLDTIDKGVIKVAIEPYMAYTDVKDGKMGGLDAEILQDAAANLGLKVKHNVTDFKGMLGGVQSHRVDITIGGVGWGAERAQKGLFTDPVYYSPPAMAVLGDKSYRTVDDLKGKKVGTVTGYVWESRSRRSTGSRRRSTRTPPRS